MKLVRRVTVRVPECQVVATAVRGADCRMSAVCNEDAHCATRAVPECLQLPSVGGDDDGGPK